MYTGFQLNLGTFSPQDATRGNQIINTASTQVKANLEKFLSANGSIDGTQLSSEWFPEVKADIFLSHSHKDKDLAINLAGWFKRVFNLDTFIDSCVWGHCNALLRAIDNQYCWKPEKEVYDYDRRNLSTSHVHMMLAASISKMMDKTECLVFLNTPASLTARDTQTQTASPWLYYEISTSRMLRPNPPNRYREVAFAEDSRLKVASYREIQKSLEMHYDIDNKHLTTLTTNDLNTWKDTNSTIDRHPLDRLYRLKFVK